MKISLKDQYALLNVYHTHYHLRYLYQDCRLLSISNDPIANQQACHCGTSKRIESAREVPHI